MNCISLITKRRNKALHLYKKKIEVSTLVLHYLCYTSTKSRSIEEKILKVSPYFYFYRSIDPLKYRRNF